MKTCMYIMEVYVEYHIKSYYGTTIRASPESPVVLFKKITINGQDW